MRPTGTHESASCVSNVVPTGYLLCFRSRGLCGICMMKRLVVSVCDTALDHLAVVCSDFPVIAAAAVGADQS